MKWTEEEVQLLCAKYRELPTSELTELFPGRSGSSIIQKAGMLGLTQAYYDWFTDPTVKICLSCDLPSCKPNYCPKLRNFDDGRPKGKPRRKRKNES